MTVLRGVCASVALIALAGLQPALAETQLDANAREARGYEAADRELNATYRQITARLTISEKQKLIVAQRAWLDFRRAECEYRSTAVEGGSAQPMVYAGCLEELTRKRIGDLRAVTLDCHEGELWCVFPGKPPR